mmetsp:Transcript_7017/g.17983  ORF Transcript_7017/g.17983 Transcript_7017/m.17983 type:complete len:931 (-) Transcript_7017:44-2836(-)
MPPSGTRRHSRGGAPAPVSGTSNVNAERVARTLSKGWAMASANKRRSSLTHRIRYARGTQKKKPKKNRVSPVVRVDNRGDNDGRVVDEEISPRSNHRRVSEILDQQGADNVSKMLASPTKMKRPTDSPTVRGGRPASGSGDHKSFRMVIASLFEEMAVTALVGPALFPRFADADAERDFKNWKWDLLYHRIPLAITLFSVLYGIAAYVVLGVTLWSHRFVLVIVLSIHSVHTIINTILSVVSWRETLWTETLHPGLLWSVAMRLFAVLGLGMTLVLIGPEHSASTLYLTPLLAMVLLEASLLLTELVFFVFPLTTTAALSLFDLCCLVTLGVLEVRRGWHDTGQVVVLVATYAVMATIAFAGLSLDDRNRREMYLTLKTHDKITSELAQERLAVQLKNAAPHDFNENIERLVANGFPMQRQVVPCEVPRDQVETREIVGKGAFGDVRRGLLTTSGENRDVAIKTCNEKSSEAGSDGTAAMNMLLEEATLMAQFRHQNVIRLLGVCTAGYSEGLAAMILMEYAEKGPLRDYIRKNRKFQVLTVGTKLTMSLDIASGMRYLSEHQFVHRDLAARNVLVMSDFSCKVADFGLSRFVGQGGNYYRSTGGALPIRWTPIEALEQNKFTEKSDVWSFGVVVFEIFSGAAKPYSKLSNQQVWLKVKAGYRMPKPSACPDSVYTEIMRVCWAAKPGDRPSFGTLVTVIDTELRKARRAPRPSSALSMASSAQTGRESAASITSQREVADLLWWSGVNGARSVTNLDLYNDSTFLTLMHSEVRRNLPEATDVTSLASHSVDHDEDLTALITAPSRTTVHTPPGRRRVSHPEPRAGHPSRLRSGPSLFNENFEDVKPDPPPRPSQIGRHGEATGAPGPDHEDYDNLYLPSSAAAHDITIVSAEPSPEPSRSPTPRDVTGGSMGDPAAFYETPLPLRGAVT